MAVRSALQSYSVKIIVISCTLKLLPMLSSVNSKGEIWASYTLAEWLLSLVIVDSPCAWDSHEGRVGFETDSAIVEKFSVVWDDIMAISCGSRWILVYCITKESYGVEVACTCMCTQLLVIVSQTSELSVYARYSKHNSTTIHTM